MSSWNKSPLKSALKTAQLGLCILLALGFCIGFIVYMCTHITTRPSVKIMSMWMNPIDTSPKVTQIAANWTIKFEVKNQGKKDINYRDIQVSVLYVGNDNLSSFKLSPFVQRRSNRTALVATPTAVLPCSSRDQIGSAIRRDAKETGIVSFDVDFRMQFEYGNKMNKNKKLGYVHFVCGGVDVRFPPGAMRENSKRCPYRKIS